MPRQATFGVSGPHPSGQPGATERRAEVVLVLRLVLPKRAKLTQHRQVVPHGPTLSDAIAHEAIHSGESAVAVTSVCLETHESTTVPAAMPGAVPHDVVTLHGRRSVPRVRRTTNEG